MTRQCDAKVRALVKQLMSSKEYFDFQQLDAAQSEAYALSAQTSSKVDFYTLYRLRALNVWDRQEVDVVLRGIDSQLTLKPKLDALLNNDAVIDALSKGRLSFEFVFTLNNSEIDNALSQAQKGENIVDAIYNCRHEKLNAIGIPPDALWKMCIDQKDIKSGPYVYDFRGQKGEPGYLCAAQSAFMYVMDNLHRPLSVDFIQEVRKHATHQVRLMEGSIGGDTFMCFGRMPSGGGTGDTGHPEQRQHIEKEDLAEILEYGFADLFTYEKGPDTKLVYLSSGIDHFQELINGSYGEGTKKKEYAGTVEEALQSIIDEYNTRIKNAKTDEDKLYAIARFGKMLDTLHPFSDGNMRTVVLITNKLLVENGFSPTIMPDPNNIDLKNSHWIVEHLIKPGQEFFRALRDFRELKISDMETTYKKAPEIGQFNAASKIFVRTLDIDVGPQAKMGGYDPDEKINKKHLIELIVRANENPGGASEHTLKHHFGSVDAARKALVDWVQKEPPEKYHHYEAAAEYRKFGGSSSATNAIFPKDEPGVGGQTPAVQAVWVKNLIERAEKKVGGASEKMLLYYFGSMEEAKKSLVVFEELAKNKHGMLTPTDCCIVKTMDAAISTAGPNNAALKEKKQAYMVTTRAQKIEKLADFVSALDAVEKRTPLPYSAGFFVPANSSSEPVNLVDQFKNALSSSVKSALEEYQKHQKPAPESSAAAAPPDAAPYGKRDFTR